MNKNLKKLISTVAALAITATSAFTAFAANFSDVADTADYKVAVDNLVALGIVNGYEDGTFGPEKEITRAEASKMIVGTMGPAMMDAAEASKGSSNFTDVAGDHWASGFIAQGVSKGYINGMGDGTFAPNANVTYAQVVKMLVCVLGYADDAEANGGWPNGYINQGTALEITDGVNVVNADTAVNRGQVAMLINNALNVPIKGIDGYEQGFKMVDGQLTPVPVPVTVVYDGTKKADYKYETLLTTYFDAYAVRGRIMSTEEKGLGQVSYKVEWSENFDDFAVNTKRDNAVDLKDPIDVYYPAGLDVDALLCSYTDAIIMENEDGDWELVSITSYGKNEVVTLASELFKPAVEKKDDEGNVVEEAMYNGKYMEFYKSATSSKTDEYDLDSEVVLYVNGSPVEGKIAIKDAVDKYIANNKTTEVKLVNTPDPGNKTVDSKYDYIMLSVYTSAIVDEVIVEEDEATIYVDYFNGAIINDAEIVIDLEAIAEGEAECIVTDVDGNEIKLEDLAYNDVITIYADFYGANPYAVFVNIVATKNVKEGKVTEEDSDFDKYAIGGEFYGFSHTPEKLAVGDDYTLYLDKFNKIVKYEKTTSSINYGIINRVWENNNGEKVVRLLTADGSVVTYEFNKPDDFKFWYGTDKEGTDGEFAKYASDDFKTVYNNVIVSYKVNSSDKIYSITPVKNFNITDKVEYNERGAKVGSAKMSDLTKIVDFSDAIADWTGSLSGKVTAGTLASFVDGEEYQVIYGGEKFTDGTYPFVIVVDGKAKISPASAFAVVKATGRSVNEADGSTYASATVLEGKEEKVVFFEENEVPTDVKRGAVIVYNLDNEGLVDEYKVLFTASDDKVTLAGIEAYANGMYVTADSEGKIGDYDTILNFDYAEYTDAPQSWKDSIDDSERDVKVGFGALIDKTSGDITVGKVVDGKTAATDYDEIDLASDVNVYVYDLGKMASERLSAGAVASLSPNKIARQFYQEDAEGNDLADYVYRWKDGKATELKTVFFKMYEGEITDVIVVVPAN